MGYIHGWFDVQVDGNHRIDEDGILEVDAYPVYLDDDGDVVTETLQTLASVRIPGKGYDDDCWYGDTRGGDADVSKLPHHVQEAYRAAHKLAGLAQGPVMAPMGRYSVGDTVFLPEYIMPGNVVARTVDGDYIVDMGDSGELAPFGESELEDYDREKWES